MWWNDEKHWDKVVLMVKKKIIVEKKIVMVVEIVGLYYKWIIIYKILYEFFLAENIF
jgi:hypothetical protein